MKAKTILSYPIVKDILCIFILVVFELSILFLLGNRVMIDFSFRLKVRVNTYDILFNPITMFLGLFSLNNIMILMVFLMIISGVLLYFYLRKNHCPTIICTILIFMFLCETFL